MTHSMKLEEFLKRSWERYIQLTPDAEKVHQLLTLRGEKIVNDHIAYRTFNLPGIGRLDLGRVFEGWGYHKASETLEFPEKKLLANYWIHPDASLPKVFISELMVEKCSKDLQEWIGEFTEDLCSSKRVLSPEFFLQPSWSPVSFQKYKKMVEESEYASWTAAFGIQLNHFTIFFNALRTFTSLKDLNSFLKSHDIQLNQQGGEIKGTPAECLEQSSTVAKKVETSFMQGEKHPIMGCYYEFARRYPVSGSSQLFQGFIPSSANRIFESTYEQSKLAHIKLP